MTRVNNIAALTDPIADWGERFVAGSWVNDLCRTESNAEDRLRDGYYRSVVVDYRQPTSFVDYDCRNTSATYNKRDSTQPETGSKPSMIDLINWND